MTWSFPAELARHGPTSVNAVSHAEARAYCAHVTRSHYENFTVVSWLLPKKLVPHFHAIYAYCRWADDLADETGSEALNLLMWWQGELTACFAGEVRHPVFVALRETVTQFNIPIEPFQDLLSAFRQDQVKKSYETFAELVDYCQRSANPVGRLVLYLFEQHRSECLDPSDAICTGLQLANFWQDVARDHAIGRVYLPQEDLLHFDVTPATWHTEPTKMRELIRFEVERTRSYFARGKALPTMLPRRARIDIKLFHAGGIAILDAIAQQNYDVLTRRPTISKAKKFRLLVGALM